MNLSSFERRWVAAIFEAVYPSDLEPRLMVGAARAGLEPFIDDLFARGPRATLGGIRLLTWVVVLLLPLLVLARPRTFMGLKPGDRTRMFEKLSHSNVYSLREIPSLYKMLGGLGYCALPEVQRAVGIPNAGEQPSWAPGRMS